MRPCCLFLLIYLLGSIFGGSSAQSNTTCPSQETCNPEPPAASQFLNCVGLPSTDTGADHLRRLKGMLEAMMDLYTFMKSSMTGVPLLSLQGELDLNLDADPLQNEALVQMWLEVKINPLLDSISKHFLSCLSTKNFSCSTYQTVVRELSQHFSEMNPVRQKWIYTFFMYPFLSGDRVTGCVNPEESSEEWLMKNFGAFRAMARLKDFSTLNMVFSGLEVLHLLSPTQMAELLMRPEVQSLDNGTLSLIFHSLMTGSSISPPTASPGLDYNWTSPGYPPVTYNPYPPSSQIADGFMTAFKPIGSFVHNFVSFTHERNVSQIRSTTLTQFLLNWTLAELADMYRPQNTSGVTEKQFDVTNVEDWYQQVVLPVLRRFLPDAALTERNITLAFYQLFNLENGINNGTSEIQDVCSITLDKTPCGLTNMVENVAYVLRCAAHTNLTLDEQTVMTLILELTRRLNSLVKELSTANFQDLASEIQQIFSETEPPSLTQQHLQDPNFISLWFQIKLLPLLPAVQPDLLSCLSTKNFSCPVYQTIVSALSKSMMFMGADVMYSHNIYKHFIFPFLLHHNTSDPQCVSSASDSADWLQKNFGFFSQFASITDFYQLNPNFSGLEALHLLSVKQIAEMLLLPLRVPPTKDVVINQVFDFLTESPADRKFLEVLQYLVQLAKEVNPPCNVLRQIFERMYRAIPSLSPNMEPLVWAQIDALITIAPEECVPENITCPVTQFNGSNICMGVDSSDLQLHLNTLTHVPCNFPLEKYACAQLGNVTANQLASLLMCDLPRNSSYSKVLWKMLLTKLSSVLDPALDILGDMPMAEVGPAAMEVLDVINEIRLSFLTDQELMNSSVIGLWFSHRLSSFLPSTSGRFLHCLTNRNLSCQSYQQILQVFINKYNNMTLEQQYVVLNNFILRFLQQPQSGAGCASNTSAEWLRRNLGPFSMRLPLRELLLLKPDFNPLEALELLAPQQIAEILELKLPTLPDKDVIINVLFDFLTQSSQEKTFSGFLPYLVVSLPQANLSCSSYKILFNRLDLAMATASLGVASSITYTKLTLSKYIPLGCVIYRGECTVTMTNETDLCIGVNSTALQLQLDAGKMSGRFCDFALEEFACASLSALTAKDLAVMLTCNRPSNTSGSRPVWKLILSKASHVLNEALDLLASMTLDSNNNALSVVLDSIREIRLDTISMASINDPAVIMLWFNRLQPFLPAVSPDFLSCLTTKGLNCSTYQHIVQILSRLQPNMTLATQMSVYTHFIKVYLTRNNTADPACSLHSNNSGQWLQANLGGFSVLVSLNEIHMLYSNFSAMEALPQLTVRQLAELSSTPGQLTTPDQVTMVMNYVPNEQLAYFYDNFSPAIIGHESTFPPLVRSAMLQVVFNRANLADPSVSDTVVLQWLGDRLRPLLVNLSPLHVAPFFRILSGRNCSTEQQGVENLNLVISTLSGDTQTGIYNHILQTLKGPTPLRCYGNNYNHSFYNFLESSFMGFQFPNLTTFLSLMPHDSMYQLVNSIPPSHLRDFLSRPDVVDNDAQLCVLYNNYAQTPVFLETESVPADVRRLTLPCVWPMALSSPTRSEVNAWFDQRLHNYLAFLTKSLISPSATYNSTCMAFQKLVLVLDQYNYAAADFGRQDVYNSIRNYLALGTGATRPRCYNPSDPELNSTAWFAEYIGAFMPFLTLEDLLTFGSKEGIQVFTVNPDNIALLSHSALPVNLTSYYTQLIYTQNSNFNPLLLPLFCLCFAPGPAFTQLTAQQSVTILHNLTTLCTDLDPQISAALAGNLGTNIDASALSALGNTSTGLSTGQISTIKPQALFESLGTLSSVSGWNQGQANAIIMSLFSSGLIKLNSSSSLIMLGSLIVGIPASMFTSIGGSELLMASKNPALLSHLLSAPQIIQQIFVTQIISVDSNSQSIIQNIPDELATEIPRNFLLSFPNSSSVITTLNRKKWKQQQVELFFDVMAEESATAQLGSVNNLSPSVLQGFTCTGVRTIQVVQIKKLIKACRRGKNKVTLVETQLTCMYNYIKDDSNATSFDLFPYDLLLYYDYILVPKASCRLYFEQLAEADFSVFSSALSYKLTALFNNAKSCLGITNTSLTADTISVLGNMCCTLDGSYIVNSHPSILDKLNNCPDLTASQAAAVETLLSSGKTKYGAPAKWNEQTLRDLGMLPLYLSSAFYDNFNKTTRGLFLRYFLKDKVVSKQKEENLKNEIRKSNEKRSKRALATGCTVGTITQVTISDQIFPFDYDVNQFNSCLSASVVKDNLNAITEKVVQKDYLKIVLSKLGEAYSANSTIPETQVRVLGTASRVATTEDINRWNITQIDTLAALMDSSNGDWDPSLARAIITKYLSTDGNKLGSAELNAIGGPNLCSLDVNVLKNISQQGLREAKALVVSNCTTEKKQELFTIAKQAFSGNTRSTVSASSYQLTKSYLAGADLSYVRSLAASNLSMDLATFTSLNENVVLNLTVSELKGLLGTNLPDLKLYENQTLVQNWISRQYQSDLNTLSLGLQGGRADTTTAPPSSVATSGTSAAATTTTTTTTTSSSSATTSGSVLGTGSSTSSPSSSTTTGTGSRIRADAGFTCLVLLMLFFLSQHAVM